MSESDKNPFSLDENTGIFSVNLRKLALGAAQEGVREEAERVRKMKTEVRTELQKLLPEKLRAAAIDFHRHKQAGPHVSVEVIDFGPQSAENEDGRERLGYAKEVIKQAGFTSTVEDGLKLSLKVSTSLFDPGYTEDKKGEVAASPPPEDDSEPPAPPAEPEPLPPPSAKPSLEPPKEISRTFMKPPVMNRAEEAEAAQRAESAEDEKPADGASISEALNHAEGRDTEGEGDMKPIPWPDQAKTDPGAGDAMPSPAAASQENENKT